MSRQTGNGLGSSRAYDAARLRWAGESDAPRLAELWRESRSSDGQPQDGEDEQAMRDWLEHGGAVLLEDETGTALCAVRWRWSDDGGWRVDRIATLEAARGMGFGRWLMTKLEALAIKRNIPTLTLDLERSELMPYYRRLGYRAVDPAGADDTTGAEPADDRAPDGTTTLVKRVGGTWQRQPGSTP